MDSVEATESLAPEFLHRSFQNETLYDTEDSGYHTSHGPMEWSYENIDSVNSVIFRADKQNDSKSVSANGCNDNFTSSPIVRRGVKRCFQETTAETPTSEIAGKIKILKVNDNYYSGQNFMTSIDLQYKENLSHPSTPVKTCKKNCKVSPVKRLGKRLDFSIHSLSCEGLNTKKIRKEKPQDTKVRTTLYRPNQKIDIIENLLVKGVTPPVIKIFNNLSNEDIYNFCLACPKTWFQVTEVVYNAEGRKRAHLKFLRNRKENENYLFRETKAYNGTNHTRCLKEINNIMNTNSPIYSFEKPQSTVTKDRSTHCAMTPSMGKHMQLLLCVQCSQPAQVREETSGELWVECTKAACSYQFCKVCKCERHPGRKCQQYDLEGLSPSKRKKVGVHERKHAIGSIKSKKILQRLSRI